MAVTIDGTNGITSPDFEPSSSTTPTNGLFLPAANAVGFATGSTERLRIDSSGNVGIGTSSPTVKFDVIGPTGSVAAPTYLNQTSAAIRNNWHSRLALVNGGGVFIGTIDSYATGAAYPSVSLGFANDGVVIFNTGSGSVATSEKMRLDASGNLGLGVTPSGWGSTFKALQEGAGSLWSYSTSGFGITANAYNNSGWKYINNGYANSFETDTGKFIWYNAPSGTAGNAISFTQAMTLDASGNLALGATSVTANHRFTLKAPTANYCQVSLIGGDTANYLTLGTLNDSNTFFISQNGTERVRIDTSGWAKFMQNTAVGYLGSGSSLTAGGSASDFMIRSEAVLSFATNGANERARIDSSGNLLVGATSSSAGEKFYVSQTNTGTVRAAAILNAGQYEALSLSCTYATYTDTVFRVGASRAANSAYNFTVFQANGVDQFKVGGSGIIYAQNTTVQSISDARLKENVRSSDDGLSVINLLRPVRFDWKEGYGNDRKNQLGFIAQEVESVFPDAVDEWTQIKEGDDETYKTVGPSALIPVMVKAIQELTARLEALENK